MTEPTKEQLAEARERRAKYYDEDLPQMAYKFREGFYDKTHDVTELAIAIAERDAIARERDAVRDKADGLQSDLDSLVETCWRRVDDTTGTDAYKMKTLGAYMHNNYPRKAPKDNDLSWHTHDGGPCPIPDALAGEWEWQLTFGEPSAPAWKAKERDWGLRKGSLDIVRYRLLPAYYERKAREAAPQECPACEAVINSPSESRDAPRPASALLAALGPDPVKRAFIEDDIVCETDAEMPGSRVCKHCGEPIGQIHMCGCTFQNNVAATQAYVRDQIAANNFAIMRAAKAEDENLGDKVNAMLSRLEARLENKFTDMLMAHQETEIANRDDAIVAAKREVLETVAKAILEQTPPIEARTSLGVSPTYGNMRAIVHRLKEQANAK